MGGKGQFGPVGMGGMFTILKVRDNLTDYDNPPEYPHPTGTVAEAIKTEKGDSTMNEDKVIYSCRKLRAINRGSVPNAE